MANIIETERTLNPATTTPAELTQNLANFQTRIGQGIFCTYVAVAIEVEGEFAKTQSPSDRDQCFADGILDGMRDFKISNTLN